MKLLLKLLLLTWAGVAAGGGMNGDCPAVCRCEGDGTQRQRQQRVECVDVHLTSVPSDLSTFTSTLSLQNNHLRTVPPGALKNLKNLRSLHLDANSISYLPSSSFRGLTSLRHLWLDDNILTEVPVQALSHLMELQALTLALNHISYVPDGAFSSLHRLLLLHLHDNRIHSLGRKSFDGLHNLETLDLSFNRINRFPAAIKYLRRLRELNLENNNISVVPENSFSGNPSIQNINLQNNPLHTVGPSTFHLLPELHTLYVSSNWLSSVSLRTLRSLKPSVNLQLRLSHQHLHRELQCVCFSVFVHSEVSVSSNTLDALSSCGHDSASLQVLHFSLSFIFIISIFFSLLILQSSSSSSSQCVPLQPHNTFVHLEYLDHPEKPATVSPQTAVSEEDMRGCSVNM